MTTTTTTDAFQQTIQRELDRRLLSWKQQVTDGVMDRNTANHRHLCLQSALLVLKDGRTDIYGKTLPEIKAELELWLRETKKEKGEQVLKRLIDAATAKRDITIVKNAVDFLIQRLRITQL